MGASSVAEHLICHLFHFDLNTVRHCAAMTCRDGNRREFVLLPALVIDRAAGEFLGAVERLHTLAVPAPSNLFILENRATSEDTSSQLVRGDTDRSDSPRRRGRTASASSTSGRSHCG